MNSLNRAAALLLLASLPLCVLVLTQGTAGRQSRPHQNLNADLEPDPGGPHVSSAARVGTTNTNGRLSPAAGAGAGPAEEGRGGDAQQPPPPEPIAEWRPPPELYGYAVPERVTLRARPGAQAAPLGEPTALELAGEHGVRILGAEGDWLRVRMPPAAGRASTEGWVEWGTILPGSWAVILDARTGKLLRREPLEAGITHATFSPDGKRVFLSNGHLNTVTEARAEDFRPLRELAFTTAGRVDDAFFQPEGGALVVPMWRVGKDPRGDYTLVFVRVGEGAIESVPTGVTARTDTSVMLWVDGRFIVAPGGRLGFAVYTQGGADGAGDGSGHTIVETFDLQTLARLRRVDFGAVAELGDPFLSRDGSELFTISGSPRAVRVYGTGDGKLLRELPIRLGDEVGADFALRARDGDSFVLSVWESSPRGTLARLARLKPDGKLVTLGAERFTFGAERSYVVEAGGRLYAADERGRRLSAFDREGRHRWTREVAAPAALRSDDHHALPPVKGIVVSPDGARVVVIVGVPVGLTNF